jgi:hypothetical protein
MQQVSAATAPHVQHQLGLQRSAQEEDLATLPTPAVQQADGAASSDEDGLGVVAATSAATVGPCDKAGQAQRMALASDMCVGGSEFCKYTSKDWEVLEMLKGALLRQVRFTCS